MSVSPSSTAAPDLAGQKKPPRAHLQISLEGSALTLSNAASVQIDDYGDGFVYVVDKTRPTGDNVTVFPATINTLTVNGTNGADIFSGAGSRRSRA